MVGRQKIKAIGRSATRTTGWLDGVIDSPMLGGKQEDEEQHTDDMGHMKWIYCLPFEVLLRM